jgi:hypothetical protein
MPAATQRRAVDAAADSTRAQGSQTRRYWRAGGTEGNEILTSAAAVVLIGLLVAEGITIVHMQGLLSAHMFIGLVLIPPVLLKLASTRMFPTSCVRHAPTGGQRAVRPCPAPARERCWWQARSAAARLLR